MPEGEIFNLLKGDFQTKKVQALTFQSKPKSKSIYKPKTAYLCRKSGLVFLMLGLAKKHEKVTGHETEAYRISYKPLGDWEFDLPIERVNPLSSSNLV